MARRTRRSRTRRSRPSKKGLAFLRRSTRKRTRRMARKVGGNLGRIPPTATVSIQQDPYSARMLVDTETAEDMLESRGPYLL